MANDVNNKGVIVADTGGAGATGTLVSVTCVIRKIRLVPAAAAALATLTNTAGDVIAALAAPANGHSDDVDFGPDGFTCEGLKLPTLSGTGAKVYVYGK